MGYCMHVSDLKNDCRTQTAVPLNLLLLCFVVPFRGSVVPVFSWFRGPCECHWLIYTTME